MIFLAAGRVIQVAAYSRTNIHVYKKIKLATGQEWPLISGKTVSFDCIYITFSYSNIKLLTFSCYFHFVYLLCKFHLVPQLRLMNCIGLYITLLIRIVLLPTKTLENVQLVYAHRYIMYSSKAAFIIINNTFLYTIY